MDEELLERCRAGDGAAFQLLLEVHQGMLFGLARRITGDREDAMDVLQDACVKAWNAIGEVRGSSFRSWMSTIVSRTALDRVRARRPHLALEDEEGVVVPLPDPRPGPERQALAGARLGMIESALSHLSPEHRAMVLMRDLGDLSYEEMAETLDIPMGTVRSRLARARLALQHELLRLDPGILEGLG
ncbi:MAG: sigma-70 family RNA polymerase sigma factor [Candidatus Dormibacteria bacterium]